MTFSWYNLLLISACILLVVRGQHSCKSGECKSFEQCLEEGGSVKPSGMISLCQRTSFGDIKVCCAKNARAIAKEKCEFYNKNVKSHGNSGNGEICQSNIPLIANGVDANVGEFPHMVGLMIEEDIGLKHICGGSLISEDFVLTAAHCIKRGQRLIALIGAHDIDNIHESGRVDPTIEMSIVHPKYTGSTSYHDIALLKLATPVPITSRVRPACLPYKNIRTSGRIKLPVIGWGNQNNAGRTSSILQKAKLGSVPLGECMKLYSHASLRTSSEKKYPAGIGRGLLCAEGQGSDACMGDSGGPLMLPSQSCVHTIVGVVSTGDSCPSHNPSVYMNVEEYLPWIVKTVWPNGV